jgi:hypothetical protein
MEAMARKFDGLHIDAGFGPVAIPSPENAAQVDAREQLERQMRDQVLFGPTNGDPMQHGHTMGIRLEDYVRYAPGSVRDDITDRAIQQQNWADDMLSEYRTMFGDERADDVEGLSAAVDATLNDLKWRGENPARWARENPRLFLQDVEINHSIGRGRRTSEDHGRTSGITSGGSAPSGAHSAPGDQMNDTDWMRQMQRAKGIY